MLVIAVAGFAMPWQYLKNNDAPKKQSADWKQHPAFKSVSPEKYGGALKALAIKFAEKINISELAKTGDEQFWTIGKCVNFEEVHDVAERKIGIIENSEITLSRLLHCLRNALAHSGFFALGSTELNIDSISFFSEIRDKKGTLTGWEVATTSVEGFRHFLNKWFELIGDPAQRLAVPEVFNQSLVEDRMEQQA
ncbi:hypothetical protein [Limnohabitans sp. JirII-29]|uniref:hypothetical protein n=1 Tax=Limnohabitans sp. JirII-29 TaxID=1835756 RepID=UPI0011B27783|nr:hypothetical protein [Limnohabitans sp. JirII-29]